MPDPTRPDPDTNNPTSDTPADGGHDESGRFAAGNQGGPGNPYARRVAQLRQRLLGLATDEDIDAIFLAMIRRAKEGDRQAAKLVLSYTVGKPAATVDPDTIDVHELEVLQQRCRQDNVMGTCVTGLPAEVLCEVLQAARPHVVESIRRDLAQKLAASVEQDRLDDLEQDEEDEDEEGPAPRQPEGAQAVSPPLPDSRRPEPQPAARRQEPAVSLPFAPPDLDVVITLARLVGQQPTEPAGAAEDGRADSKRVFPARRAANGPS
jgi:hypothetical protein